MAEDTTQIDGAALAEAAIQLGINPMEYDNNEALDRAIQDRIKEVTNSVRVARGASAEEEQAQRDAFDETIGDTRGVMVRVVEWTEWLPAQGSEHWAQFYLQNGVTGFEAGENERVHDISVSRLGQVKEVPVYEEGHEGDASKVAGKVYYTLYAFQAVLAQNVLTSLIADFIALQGGDKEGTKVKGEGSAIDKLIQPGAPAPNRATRRAGGRGR